MHKWSGESRLRPVTPIAHARRGGGEEMAPHADPAADIPISDPLDLSFTAEEWAKALIVAPLFGAAFWALAVVLLQLPALR